jgi:hypothetical protein
MVLIVKKNISSTNDINQDLEVNNLKCDNLEIQNGGSITLPPASFPPSAIQPGTVTVDDMTKLSEISGNIVDTQRTQTISGAKTFNNDVLIDVNSTLGAPRILKVKNSATSGDRQVGISFENAFGEMFITKESAPNILCISDNGAIKQVCFNENAVINLEKATGTYNINGNVVLSQNTLGTNIINSSLTSVGTLANLNIGTATGTGGILDIREANPTVNIEATTTNATLQLTGPDKRVSFDSAFDIFHSQTNPNDFEIRNSSNIPIFRLNGLTGSLGVGAPSVGAPSNVALNIDSNVGTKTIQLPIFTTAQRNAYLSPNNGMLIYNETSQVLEWYNGSSWLPINSLSAPSGDIMGTTDTHTISGTHTYNDNSFIVQDDADNTKKANFQCSTITTGQTRTFTFPDVTGELLTNNSTSTITNKTFSDNTSFNSGISTNSIDDVSGGRVQVNADLNLPLGQNFEINGTSVLNAFTLGSTVVNSSLTSVGTLNNLTVSGNINTTSGEYQINGNNAIRTTSTATIIGNNANTGFGNGVTLVGRDAGLNWTAPSIVAIGRDSLLNSVGNTGMCAIGHQCMENLAGSSNINNTGTGHNCMANAVATVDGDYNNNSAYGFRTMQNSNNCQQSSAFGADALRNCQGNNNLGLGYQAGLNITTGSNNICVGSGADTSTNSGANRISIGVNCSNAVDNSFKVSNATTALTSALINVDTFQVQPNSGNNDAILSLKRGGGLLEDLRLETRTGGLFIRNELATTDLTQINNSVFDVLVGNLNIQSGNLQRGGVQVVTSRQTGYTNAITGTANRATTYDTSTITLQQLAERVKAIQDDLTLHGLIGV